MPTHSETVTDAATTPPLSPDPSTHGSEKMEQTEKGEERENAGKIPCWLTVFRICSVLALLWVFLFGLGLMGTAFKVLGGKSAGEMFNGISNPVAGLMVGILATVLVQSSSTTTSIVVSLVASGIMTVQLAIPIVMGANIGTSVTNTIVSLGHFNNKEEFCRAFSGATVHDMFNYLSVAVLLPVEIITSAINGGNGGIIYLMTKAMMSSLEGAEGGTFKSPVKVIADPAVKFFLAMDKNKIKALSMGPPALDTCLGTASKPKVVAKVGYTICGNQTALDESLATWQHAIVEGSLVKGGVFKGVSDGVAGAVCLIIALVALCLALFFLVKVLKSCVGSANQSMLSKALNMNGYLAMLVGALATVVVQSSSIVTSMLVPLVGLGTLSLEQMLPLTLGANIGTTCTALLAALASGAADGLQIALCHLMFNILGIALFYPVPAMRKLPINMAKALGYFTVCFNWFPFAYMVIAFFVIPLVFLGISALITAGGTGAIVGWVIVVPLLIGIALFVFFYKKRGLDTRIQTFLEIRYNARKLGGSHDPVPTTELAANGLAATELTVEV